MGILSTEIVLSACTQMELNNKVARFSLKQNLFMKVIQESNDIRPQLRIKCSFYEMVGKNSVRFQDRLSLEDTQFLHAYSMSQLINM